MRKIDRQTSHSGARTTHRSTLPDLPAKQGNSGGQENLRSNHLRDSKCTTSPIRRASAFVAREVVLLQTLIAGSDQMASLLRYRGLLLTAAFTVASGCAGRLAQPAAVHARSHEVSLHTADGWTIVGDLYTASPARGDVILLHQRGGTASDWQPLCAALQKAGITALAIDQRGAGRSTTGPGPVGADAPWSTSGDISAAVAYLKPGKPVGLAGASYGANNALIYGAGHSAQIAAVALFSPGANYNGLDALAAARGWAGPTLIYHDRDDTIAGGGPQQIASLLHHAQLHVLPGGDHGTALLSTSTVKQTVQFFRASLR